MIGATAGGGRTASVPSADAEIAAEVELGVRRYGPADRGRRAGDAAGGQVEWRGRERALADEDEIAGRRVHGTREVWQEPLDCRAVQRPEVDALFARFCGARSTASR